jgi:hypothetical protein
VKKIKVTHHKSRKMKSSHAHLHNGLQFRNLPVQIIPTALKMRMMVTLEVNSHNPVSGHCPLNPEGV